jgi:hypothetical protein
MPSRKAIDNSNTSWVLAAFKTCPQFSADLFATGRTAITSRKKLLLQKYSTIKPNSRASTRKPSRITAHTRLALRLE